MVDQNRLVRWGGLTGCFYYFGQDSLFLAVFFWRNLLFLAEPGSPTGVGGEDYTAGAEGPRAGHHKRGNPENFFGDEQSARPVVILHSGHRHFAL